MDLDNSEVRFAINLGFCSIYLLLILKNRVRLEPSVLPSFFPKGFREKVWRNSCQPIFQGLQTLSKRAREDVGGCRRKKIEGWEEALQEVEIPGARVILRDLGALKRQLDQDEPDGDRIRTILSRLADATMKISDKVEDRNADKVRDLGQALETASEEDEEEEMDRNQEPRRSSSQRVNSARSSSQRYRDEDEEDHRGPSGRVRDPEHGSPPARAGNGPPLSIPPPGR